MSYKEEAVAHRRDRGQYVDRSKQLPKPASSSPSLNPAFHDNALQLKALGEIAVYCPNPYLATFVRPAGNGSIKENTRCNWIFKNAQWQCLKESENI